MTRDPLTLEDLWGVYAVPPLPRKADGHRSLDLDAAEKVARHIADGGITRFLYGGNAFLYHISLAEYETLLDWLADFPAPRWPIPSLGPSCGRAIDQACILRRHAFPTRDGAALRRSARSARMRSRHPRDRRRRRHAAHHLPEIRGRLRIRPRAVVSTRSAGSSTTGSRLRSNTPSFAMTPARTPCSRAS